MRRLRVSMRRLRVSMRRLRVLRALAWLALVPGVALAAPPPRPAKLAAAELAAYRKHLRAGRKLGDEKRWGEAVVELEAALVTVPLDGRALSELGWAAFAAGDYAKARRANTDAVRVAADLKVKAASLYTLGRVAEATGDKLGALRAYSTSLAYRPGNPIVRDALAALEKAAPTVAKTADQPPCADERGKLLVVCGCLLRAESTDEVTGPDCSSDDRGDLPEPFWIVSVNVPAERTVKKVLVAHDPDDVDPGFHTVAALDSVYNPGSMGISEEWSLGGAELVRLGKRRVLRLRETHSHIDNDRGINETESTEDEDVTVCVVGDAETPTRCPLQLTLRHEYVREVMFPDDPDDTEKHAGLPRREGYRLSLSLDASGTATVKLDKGVADERARAALGPHKLW
jgi:hypothetical protein